MGKCSCGRKTYALGLCKPCYKKKQYHNDPNYRNYYRNLSRAAWRNKNRPHTRQEACKLIQQHEQQFSDDPERLDATRIREIIHIECPEEAKL